MADSSKLKSHSAFAYDMAADEDLTALAQSGDTRAEEVLLRRFKGLVLAAASNYYIEGADRDDVVQEGMIGLFESIRDYTPDRGAAFRTFAALCINRQILNAVERASRKKHKILNDSLSFDESMEEADSDQGQVSGLVSVSHEGDPELAAINNEALSRLLDSESGVLSPFERQVWELLALGMSQAEAAEALGKSGKSIDNASQRIRRKIRGILSK